MWKLQSPRKKKRLALYSTNHCFGKVHAVLGAQEEGWHSFEDDLATATRSGRENDKANIYCKAEVHQGGVM